MASGTWPSTAASIPRCLNYVRFAQYTTGFFANGPTVAWIVPGEFQNALAGDAAPISLGCAPINRYHAEARRFENDRIVVACCKTGIFSQAAEADAPLSSV